MKRKLEESSDSEENEPNSYHSCQKCSKRFKSRKYLNQHMQVHTARHKGELCEKTFSFVTNLKCHQENVHAISNYQKKNSKQLTCKDCKKIFSRKFNLVRHSINVHSSHISRENITLFPCRHCDAEFHNYDELFRHIEHQHPLNQHPSINQHGGGRVTAKRSAHETENNNSHSERYDDQLIDVTNDATANDIDTNKRRNVRVDAAANTEDARADATTNAEDARVNAAANVQDIRALQDSLRNRIIYPRQNERYDVLIFFANIREDVMSFLRSRTRDLGGIKWNLCVQVEMQRDAGEETTSTTPFFRSRTYVSLSPEAIDEHDLNEALQKMYASLEKYLREGSGWFVKKVLKFEIHTVAYKPLSASTYIPLPVTLAKSNSLLNIRNHDDKCFLYCVLASLHPANDLPQTVEHYLPYEQEVVMTGITYPVTLSSINRFEKQNENISINVFTYDDGVIVPLRVTDNPHRLHHVNLLLLKSGKTSHYCLITDLDRFLFRTHSRQNRKYFCCYCLHGFTREDLLKKHQPYCYKNGPQRVDLPESEASRILEFKDFEKTLKVPFVIYADFETLNSELHTCSPNPEKSSCCATRKLEVCGYAYKVVCEDERYTKSTVVYRGPDAATKLIQSLLEEQEEIQQILSQVEPMEITTELENILQNSTHCCLCKKQFTEFDRVYNKIVRHHNHLTGKLIGAACNTCNLNCKQSKFTCVLFHNLRNFDAHILCESLGQFKDYKLSCIAQTTEKYVSFSLGGLRFLDSFQFLPSSLENLVETLAQEGIDSFPHLLSEFESKKQAELLLRKGVYPYDYVTSFEAFDEKELPPIEEFYSSLKRECVSTEDYAHAQTVFHEFNMSSLGDYHDLYVKTDVVLLCDVFESFRSTSLNQYELDPCHFYTSPGLSWASLLKMTGVKLELLTDIDQVLMIEAGIRGGLSQISNRYKKANNPYLTSYEPSKPTSYLQYLDANNLYGWAMSQPLPVGNFKFMEDIANFDVMKIPPDGETGYILEVSLHYPQELHALHNCLPLAVEQKSIPNEQLSPYAQYLLRKLHGLTEDDPLPPRGKVKKLLATLDDKNHYVLHYRNLQLYVQLGMKIKEIHRILQFKQEAWMRPYIEFNTDMRKKANSTFHKNFYKLLNVAVFGKTMENVRKHKNIELVHRKERLLKLSSKPTYKNTIIFNEDLVAVELFRSKVTLSKPSYSGMCILDLSKYLMYDFWYNHIKKKYGSNAQLQMTDTDSLLFYCETADIYEDMRTSLKLFDTSDYPLDHPTYSDRNKKELGKMKDETNGVPISEFIGLRSKMYSFLCDKKEEKRAKGIAKITVKKDIRHEHYREVLFQETQKVSSMISLRSHQHELFCENVRKTGLSAFDDKRYLINNVESYAYGHHEVKREKDEDEDPSIYTEAVDVTYHDTTNGSIFEMLEEPSIIIDDVTAKPCVFKLNI